MAMMKLPSRNQLIVIVAVLIVVALVVYFATRDGMDFGVDPSGLYVEGTYPRESGLPAVAPEYQQNTMPFQEQPISEMAARGADRAAGYGTSYHIVGEQVYPCNNDPNSLGTYPCGVDDYSIWQDGTKKDFTVNPVYGEGQAGGCRIRYFPASQNPMNYNSSGDCRCSANQHPRETFNVNDNFIHVGRRWTGSNRWAKVGDQIPPAQPPKAPQSA